MIREFHLSRFVRIARLSGTIWAAAVLLVACSDTAPHKSEVASKGPNSAATKEKIDVCERETPTKEGCCVTSLGVISCYEPMKSASPTTTLKPDSAVKTDAIPTPQPN
jgi:hypothetical protein